MKGKRRDVGSGYGSSRSPFGAPRKRLRFETLEDRRLLSIDGVWREGTTVWNTSGCLEPTPEQRVWEEQTAIVVQDVRRNELALERLNAERQSEGLATLAADEFLVAAQGEEIVGVLPPTPGEEIVGASPSRQGELGGEGPVSSGDGELPSAVDNSKLAYFPPIRTQGSLGSCTSFATTYYTATYMTAMARGWNVTDSGDANKFSPKWTYNLVNGGDDNGSSLLGNYRVLLDHGSATWSQFPYDSNYTEWVYEDPAIWREAIGLRMDAYGYVEDVDATGFDAMKTLLADGYVLNFSTNIDGWLFESLGNDPATPDDDLLAGQWVASWGQAVPSAHAMTVVGYNDSLWVDINENGVVDTGEKGALKIANSWGDTWQNNGFVWLAYDAMRHTSLLPDGPSENRQAAFGSDRVYWLTAKSDYQPSLVAEFTVRHAARDELSLTLGKSPASATLPVESWAPEALTNDGGPLGFDGVDYSANPAEAPAGTFVLDFTGLALEHNVPTNYFLGLNDTTNASLAGELTSFRLLSASGDPLAVCHGEDLPIFDADGSATIQYAAIEYSVSSQVGIHIVESGGTTLVKEGAWTDSYTVFLGSRPSADVVITIQHDTQLTIEPVVLTITPDAWNQPRKVTVRAVDDAEMQGDRTSTITYSVVSEDPDYEGIAVPSVVVAVLDDELLCQIEGQLWCDFDADGVRDAIEPPIVGWTVFLDTDGCSDLDAGEASTISDSDGAYVFRDLPPGVYTVRRQIKGSYAWEQTCPVCFPHSVTLLGGDTAAGVDFGDRPAEAPEVNLYVNDSAASEPNDDAWLELSRSGPFDFPLTVSVQIEGTAARDRDYRLSHGITGTTIVFAAGWASANVLVSALDDSETEACESVTVTLLGGAGSVVGANERRDVWIADDEDGPRRVYVDSRATGDNDGTSWTDAYSDLSTAIFETSCGDEIWVAEGTYTPGVHRDGAFSMKRNVAIYGGFAGDESYLADRDWLAHPTVLSGDIGDPDDNADNVYHVVKAWNVGIASSLDGFTITGGNAPLGNIPNGFRGAGILVISSSPTLSNLKFVGNSAYAGGAVCFISCSVTSNTLLVGCVFEANYADDGGGAASSLGSATAIFRRCAFVDNVAVYQGGAVERIAGAFGFENCVFVGNSSFRGGAVYSDWRNSVSLVNCSFIGNTATRRYYGYPGQEGGAVFNRQSELHVANCVFWGNTDGGGADESAQIHVASGSAVVSYSCIQGWAGGLGGVGNGGGDPRLYDVGDPAGADGVFFTLDDGLVLMPGSSCIDAASGTEAPTTDVLGNPRHDDPAVPNTGIGPITYADMGAYEFVGVITPSVLTMKLSATQVREDAGPGAVTATVRRSGPYTAEGLLVTIQSSDTTEAVVPIVVTIPAGQSSVQFAIDIVDDAILDGARAVTVTALATGYVSSARAMTVLDYETLSVEISPSEIADNAGLGAALVTVTRSNAADLENALTMELASGHSAIQVPAWLTIPVGEVSASVPLDALDRNGFRSVGQVILTASAPGYVGIPGAVEATDPLGADPGGLDPNFAGDGFLTAPWGIVGTKANGLAIQSDGKLVAVGTRYLGTRSDVVITRYHPDGTLDATFDGDGQVCMSIASATSSEEGKAVVIQPDGKIVVVVSQAGPVGLIRCNADGSLDTTFSDDGKVSVSIGPGFYPASMALQSDGKTVVAGYASTGSNYDFALVRFNPDGSLDTGFDGDGTVFTPIGTSSDYATSVAIQPDGKIVAAGYCYNPTNRFALARYNPDGSLDATFDGDGKLTTAIGTFGDYCYGMAITPDGRIVVAGASNNNFAVARYTENGSLDVTFDGDGKQTTSFASSSCAYAVRVQPDGKIVVGGYAYGSGYDFALARYNSDGSPDTTFDDDGKLTTSYVPGMREQAYAIAIQSDARIVAAGVAGSDLALARYSIDGSLDTAFGEDGRVVTTLCQPWNQADDLAYAVAVQNDDKIVAVGRSFNGSDYDFAVCRYDTSGSLDPTFDGDGRITTSFSSSVGDEAYAVAIQPDGKIVVAGKSGGRLALARYKPDGSLDSTFDGDGKQTTGTDGVPTGASGVAIQLDGKIVLAGYEYVGGKWNLALARYIPDGSLDATFDGDGRVTTAIETGIFSSTSFVIQPDGKIVVAACSDGGYPDLVLARFNPDGSLDVTFDGDGKVTAAIDLAKSVALQPDGKILVAGSSNNDIAVARYNPDGTLDNNFNGEGKVCIPVGSSSNGRGYAYGLAIQKDGKIVVAGYSWTNNRDFAVVRLSPNGSLDTVFHDTGKVITPIGAGHEAAHAVAIQADGRIVVAGFSENDGQYDFAVARYQGDGPGTIGIADLDVEQNAADASVDLFAAFGDPNDSADNLTYTVSDDSNPTLFDFLTVDGLSGTLALDFAPNRAGMAEIRVRATDPTGWYVETTFTVTVVNEPPTVVLTNTISMLSEEADTTSRIKVADIVVTDDGGGSNALSLSGADQGLFEIDGTALYLKAGAVLDFEPNPVLDVIVAVDDTTVGTTPDDSAALSITVTDVNEPPTVALTNRITTISEGADTTSRTKVADIVVTEDGLGSNALSLSGAHAELFEIVGTMLYLKAGAVLDHETNPELDVTVAVDDTTVGAAPDDSESLSIAVGDVNEPPTVNLTNWTATISEGEDTTSRIKVADIVVTDDGLGSNALNLIGADLGLFEIVGTVLYLKAGAVLDHETHPVLDVIVAVDDMTVGTTPDDSEPLAITVGDVNEPPTVTLTNRTATIYEGADTTSRIKVADIVVTDDGMGSNTLSLCGADAERFEIVGTALYLKAGAMLDHETNPELDVTVAVDDTTVGTTPDDSEALSITVGDVNEPPTVALTNTITTLSEGANTTNRIKVADIVVTDDGLGSNALSLLGADLVRFEIVGTVLYLKAGAVLDFETNPALDVIVAVDDMTVGATPDSTAALRIVLIDQNETPALDLANVSASLPENTNTTNRTKVADITVTDDALGTNALTLSGFDAALFEIIGDVLYLKAGAALNRVTNPTLEVTIAVNDPNVGGTPDDAQSLSIAVTLPADPRIQSVLLSGGSVLSVTYEITGGPAMPFEIGFYRSTDTVFASDLSLDSLLIEAPADRTLGPHTKTFMVGGGADQVTLPGAGAVEVDSDYFLLAVVDPQNLINETTSPGGETNNTAVMTGVYHVAGGPVMIHGISTRDVIKVAPRPGPQSLQVDFNGAIYPYVAGEVTGVRIRGHVGSDEFQFTVGGGFGTASTLAFLFDGGSGTNTAKVRASSSTTTKDVAKIYPMTASFSGLRYTLSLAGMRGMTVTSQGGPDEAYVYDSSLDDILTAYPTYVTLSNSLYTNRAEGFRNVFAYAQVGGAYMPGGGNDVAYFYGIEGTRDYFCASAMYAIMADAETGRGKTYFVRGNWFEQVHACGRSANGRPSAVDRDQAMLYDAATTDLFEAETANALARYMYSGASAVYAHTFRVVKGYGAPGDTANLYGPGTYNTTPNPVMYTSDHTVWANGFDPLHGYPSGRPAESSPRSSAVDAALPLLFGEDLSAPSIRKRTSRSTVDLAIVEIDKV